MSQTYWPKLNSIQCHNIQLIPCMFTEGNHSFFEPNSPDYCTGSGPYLSLHFSPRFSLLPVPLIGRINTKKKGTNVSQVADINSRKSYFFFLCRFFCIHFFYSSVGPCSVGYFFHNRFFSYQRIFQFSFLFLFFSPKHSVFLLGNFIR